MKNLTLAMLLIATTIISCKKEAITTPVQTKDLLPSNAHYYCNGKPVTHQSEITNLNSHKVMILATDKIDGSLAYYFFDNDLAGEDFISHYPELNNVLAHVQQTRAARDYANIIHENEYVAQHGSSSKQFTDFLAQNAPEKRVIQGTLYANVAYVNRLLDKVVGIAIPVFLPGINDNTESVKYAGAGVVPYTLCENFNFTGANFVVAANIGTLWPVFWGNRASSVF